MRKLFGCLLISVWLLSSAAADSTKQNWAEFSLSIAGKKVATPEDKARLVKLLNSKDQETLSAAAFALRELQDASPETLAALERHLDASSNSEATRSVCAFTLMCLGKPGQTVLWQRTEGKLPLQDRIAAITALRANLEGLKDRELQEKMKAIFPEIDAAYNPPLGEMPNGSPLSDPAFRSPAFETDWTFEQSNGGKGRVSFDASQSHGEGGSLKLEKFNAAGEVSLRSKQTLLVKAGETQMVRFYFRENDAPAAAILQVVFERKDGHLTMGDSPRGWGPLAQTLSRNQPPGVWSKRFIQARKSDRDEEYYIRIMLRGDPATVWVDDVGAPAAPFAYAQTAPTETLREPDNVPEPTVPTTAEFRREGDRNRLVINGEVVPPVLYMILRSSFGDYAGMEQLAQVKLLVSSVPFSDIVDRRYPPVQPVWQRSGVFDFTTPLRWLEEAANKAPHSSLVLNLHFCWPKDWVDLHPAEAWVDEKGRRAYGTGVHLKGFADQLPAGGDPKLPDAGEAEYRWWPSPFSELALKDAEEGIRQFVAILKTKPYANRVVGIHISGGHDYQFMTGSWPDYSPAATVAFRQWLGNNYASDEALQKAWGDPSVTRATAEIPNYEDLAKIVGKNHELFLDPVAGRRYVEHQQIQAKQGLVIRERLAAAFKKEWERPSFAMTWQMGGGRGQGVEDVMLNSQGIDLLVTQPYYGLRLPGNVGGLRSAPLASFALHGKMGIKELDMRTWLRMSGTEFQGHYLGAAMNPQEFRQIYRREAAQMIAAGQGYWFFDIATNAFRDPKMLAEIAEGQRAYRELEINNPTPVRPNVALVWVDESPYWMADYFKETSKILGGSSVSILQTVERFTSSCLKQSGVPYDDIYLSDLLQIPDINKYKVLVFPDAFRLTVKQREEIRQKLEKNGRTLVWNYAPGYVGDEELSDQAVGELTGITVQSDPVKTFPKVRFVQGSDALTKGLVGVVGMGEMAVICADEGVPDWKMPLGFRRFTVTDREAIPIATYGDGKTAVAVKRFPGWTSVYFGMLGTLDGGVLNRIAKEAGALVLADDPVAMEFNGRFLSLHGLRNGPVAIHLPSPSRVIDFDTGLEIGHGRDISIGLQAGDTRWFRVEPQIK